MPQLCTKCSRANPPEAVYCHYDGFVLGGHERRGGPISVGSQPFNSPFVFPTGRNCRSFDELALACQAEWPVACELLKDGYLESFLGGLGRVDLARAAKEAARFPDVERGLDQLLEKIPSSALQEPKLQVDPLEVSLGVLDSAKERTLELELDNVGGRLLYGTAVSDCVWLSVGEGGANEKHFQFTGEAKIKVHVRPATLRAGSKPVEGKILLESNGGAVTVVLKAEKPVKPFPSGALKGAKTPRQVAEFAMKAAKEVGPLFESGEVEKWYADNGWIYPVKTPAASGLAALQQFFEALGVTKPPKVEVNKREFVLNADPGDMIPLSLEVSTQEKKAVWAHATSNVPWLEVSRPKFDGRKAVVAMSIPSVPDRPGETLRGELTVIGNGSVKWLIPVSLAVGGEDIPEAAVFDFAAPAAPPPRPKTSPEVQVEPPPRPRSNPEITDEPPRRPPPPPPPSGGRRAREQGGNPILHLIPAALLGLAVMVVIVVDLVAGKPNVPKKPIENDKGGESWDYNLANLKDRTPRVGVQFTQTNRFGVVVRDSKNPDDPRVWKRLTFAPDGSTNNTVVRIGDSDGFMFGDMAGGANSYEPRGIVRADLPKPRIGGRTSVRYRREQMLVTQHVEIVPGRSALLDTVLVYYSIRNDNTVAMPVGLRVMLDTFIGSNDGVPFTIPGERGFVETKRALKGPEVPDYVEVVENPNDDSGTSTTVRLGLRGIRLPKIELTEPGELVICKYQGPNVRWDFPQDSMKADAKDGDSCVAIYWPQKSLEPKETRHYAFTYGLGELDIGDRLALSVPDRVVPGRDFPITCYVFNAREGQDVKLNLPAGLELAGGEAVDKKVTQVSGNRALITWRVRAARDGTYPVTATSNNGRSKETRVVVKALGLFG